MQGCRQDTRGHMLNTLAYSSICDHSGLPRQVDSPTGVTYNDNVSWTSRLPNRTMYPGQVGFPTGVTYNDNVSMEGYRVGY